MTSPGPAAAFQSAALPGVGLPVGGAPPLFDAEIFFVHKLAASDRLVTGWSPA